MYLNNMLDDRSAVAYSSVINMSTALVSVFDDIAVVHEPESDRVRLLSDSVVAVLRLLDRTYKAEDQVLELICQHCLDLSAYDQREEESKAYLQHLIDQGIIRKLNDSV